MDFAAEHFATLGHGRYVPINPQLLPPLYLAFISEPSFSGKVHSPLRARFDRGEPAVVEAMQQFARYAERTYELFASQSSDATCLAPQQIAELAQLMDDNFDLRHRILGSEVIGAANLRMVELARSLGLAAKFTGSGGAVVCLSRDGSTVDVERVRPLFAAAGCEFVRVTPLPAGASGSGVVL